MDSGDGVVVYEALADHELVPLAQDGDREAMAALLDRHFDYVHKVCRRILFSPQDVEDARQDALLQAALRIATFGGRAQFRTWLHVVTVNVCLKSIQRAARRDIPIEGEFDEFIDDEVSLNSDPATLVAVRHDVEVALAALSRPFRDVVVLYYYCDMEQDEIAGVLGISRVTVATRLNRAKKKLKPVLENLAEIAGDDAPGCNDEPLAGTADHETAEKR